MMMTLLEFAPLILVTLMACFGAILIFSAEADKSKSKKRNKKTVKHA
jgi:uncharacterized integral membrane protein